MYLLCILYYYVYIIMYVFVYLFIIFIMLCNQIQFIHEKGKF